MKHTKKFLTRMLTVLLVVMTLFSTMSIGFTASAATVEDQPQEYTQTFDLGGTPDEAPQGETQVETPEKKPEESDDSKDADVTDDAEVTEDSDSEEELVAGEEIEIPVRTDKEDIADVGANVDHAGTGANQAPSTVKYAGDLNSWGQTSGSTWTFTNVAAGTYEFKVVDSNGTWYGNNGTMKSGDSGWDFWDDCRNCKFTVPSKASKVVFKWSNARMSYTVYYNVTWQNGDGSTLETDEVKHGGSATCSKTPTKASTAQYTYTHSGWDKSASSVTSIMTIKPTFTSTVRSYTVTWKNGDGTTLDTKTVNYGSSASTSKTPTKASTAQYSYTFTGWDKDTSNVTGNMTVTPQFSSTTRSYTLTIKAGTNGKSVSPTSKSIKYGGTYDLDNVTVTANTGYKFSSWSVSSGGTLGSGNVVTVKGNCTATANFTKQSYTVKFVDWDGTQLSSQSVKYQEAATAPSNPTRTGYTFAGWDKSYSSITAATTITATYTINSYTISVAVDSSSTGSGTVSGGGKGNYNTTKQISATASTGSTFTKWSDGNTSNPRTVTIGASNKTYYAIFTINTYTIKASVNNTSGGTASSSVSSLTHGNTVTLTPTAKNGYYFSGWDIQGSYTTTAGGLNESSITIKPTSNITAKAYFYAYNVRLPGDFNSWDQSATMSLGSNNVYTKKVELAPGSYEFKIIKNAYDNDQWYGNGTSFTDSTSGITMSIGGGNCKINATGGNYTFTYNATTDKLSVSYSPYVYTVTAKVGLSGAGTAKAGSTSVNISKTTTLTATVNAGYTFNGWTINGNYEITSGSASSKSLTIAVYGNITATANYTAHKGTVNFSAQTGGSVTNSGNNSVTYPTAASSKVTVSTGYTFAGWEITGGTEGTDWDFTSGDASSTSISIKVYTNNDTISAKAKINANKRTINFTAGTGGSVTEAGGSVTYPNTTSSTAKPSTGYHFTGWTVSGGTAGTDYKITSGSTSTASITVQPLKSGTTTFTANFKINSYTVKFVDHNGSELKTQTVTHGSAATPPSDPSRTGYTFTGWSPSYSNITADTTITAQYKINTYTVTLTKDPSAGGSVSVNDSTIDYNKTCTITAVPNEGYSFVKWEITSGTGKLASATSASTTLTVQSNITVKATFDIAVYTVNFRDHAEFGGEIVNTQYIEHGSNASAPASSLIKTEKGWEFYSWGDASAYQNVKKNLDIYAVRSNMNVQLLGDGNIGGWTTGEGMRMTYNSNGTNTKTVTLPKGTYGLKLYTEEWGNWRGNNGTVVDTTDTTASAGWDMDGGNNLTLQASGGKYTFTYYRNTNKLKITFTPIQYSVTASASPSAGGTVSVSNGSVNLGDTTTLKVTKTNPGYTFSKWTFTGTYKITDGSATSKNVTINPSTAVTATAVFTANSGTVTYASTSGGSVTNMKDNPVTYPGEVKSTATANSGYTFSGWTIEGGTAGTDYVISTGSTSTATIGIKVYTNNKTIKATANFNANESIVKFVAGTGGTVTNAGNNNVTYPGKKASVATPADSHNFVNWTISGGTLNTDYKITAGGTDKTNIEIQPITGKTITVTANFTIKQYTVTFNNWDGSKIKTQLVDHGSDATAPTNPTRPSDVQYNYTFKGWDKGFTNVTSNLTVTATYSQTVRKYTVTFKDYNGTVLSTQQIEYGKGATAPANPSRSDGFIFDKWDKAFNNITGDLTVTAVYWDNNVYLAGSFTAWEANSSNKMSYGNVSSITFNLDEGDYQFKFIYKGYWQGNNGEVVNTTDNNGVSNPWETYDGNNIRLKAIGGKYTFTFNKETYRFEVKHTPIVYTVKFYNGDTLLKTQSVNRGDNATAPANPTKAADAQYTYTFKGWDKDFTGVRSNLTVKALYTETLNKYVVTFKDHDGSTLKTQNVEYGKAATAPETPVREGYTFTGWDKEFNNITGALTVTAKYSINSYTVKFVNWDGTELKTESVQYNSGATAPDNPTRPADAQYTYTFKGWDKSFSKITGPTTITATYTQTVNTYTVTFVNYDGYVYKTQTVEYGKSATAPSNPSRNDGWKFIGWDKEFNNITGNLTVTANWEDDNVYLMGVTGTWDKTDSTLSKIKMSYANTAVMSLKLSAGNYEFKFIYKDTWLTNTGTVPDTTNNNGSSNPWETYQASDNIKLTASGGTYTFKFNKSTQRFEVLFISDAKTVTFKNDDGSVLATAMVEKGKTAASVAPANPTKNSTAQYTYTFAGWTPNIDTTVITEDTVFTATYTQTVNKYTVTFVNWDDSVLHTDTVDYGTAATAPAAPKRAADAQYTYTFAGWSQDFSNVTSNMTVKAQYTSTVNKYTVTFKYYDASGSNELTETQQVEYGKAATAPTLPTRTDGWVFTGWDNNFDVVTANITATAQYRDDNIYLNGSFFDNWGYNKTMSKSGDVYSYTVTLVPGTYKFKLNQNFTWYGNYGTIEDTTATTAASGWDMQADAGDCTLKASGGSYTFKFNNATKKLIVEYAPTTYTVKFVDWDDTQIGSTQTIAIGKPAVAPADPTRESTESHDYTFSGWSEDFSAVTKDMVIKAQYTETLRKYTVTFVYIDADGKTEKREDQQVEYSKAAIAPELPVRVDGQALRNWDKEFNYITGDLTVTAVYFDDNTYIKGSFNNWDNSGVLQTYGDKTVSKRIELAPGTYEFKFFHDGSYYTDTNAGTVPDTTGEYWWSTTDNGGVGNTKLEAKGGWYTFTYNTETKAFKIAYEPYMYTVTFKDYDGEVLDTQQVAISTAAQAPETPTRTDGWVFESWDKDFSNITGDLTVTAVYYDNNIYLMGINGDWTTTNANNRLTNKGTQNVVELAIEIGKTAGDTFTQSQHEFKFKQHNTWYTYRPTSGSSKVITDSTMSAWYNTSTNDVDNRNTILQASGGKYTFKFATDTKNFNIHYDAIKYEVIFYDYAQNVLKTEMVDIGKGATAPDVPTRSNGFKFLKWDKDFSCITDRTQVYARYYDDKMYLSGDFNNWGTTALATYGEKIQSTTMVLEPGSYSFNFFHNEPVNGEAVRHYHTDINNGTFENETISDNDGWWDTKKADGGQTTLVSTGGIYTFFYNTETNQFKVSYTPNVFDVTFVYYDEDGKTLIEDVQDVKLGEDAIAPEVPVRKDGWVFSKWDKEFTNIQADLIVNAEYIDENVYFTAQFNNWNEKATPLALTENEDIVKITLEFGTGEYDFKFHKGDGWYSFDGTINDETTAPVQMSASVANNAKLKATGGFYTFTYNKANDTVTVDYDPYVFTVTFVDYDEKVLKTEEVAISKGATAPADPTRNDGWIFTGWDKMFDNIQSDLTVKAQYKDDNVYLMGIDKGWTKENCNIMKSSDGNTATYTIRNVSAAATYEFKFLYEDVWYTDVNAGTVDNKTDGWWSTTDNQSVGNTKLNVSGGSYEITFNKTDKTFKIEHKPNIYHVTFNYYGKTYLEPITTTVAVEAGGDVELPVLETRTDEWFYLFWAENQNGEPYGTRYTQTITNVTQDMTIQAWYFDDNAYLVGQPVDGNWNRTLDNIMEDYNFEQGTSQKVIHLDPGSYEFKVIHRHDGSMNDYMYGNTGTINDTCYNWDMSTAVGNCVINASGGTYTFTFDRITKRLSVSYVPDFFEVTFVDYDGTILDTQTVQSSHAAVAPEHAKRTDGWEFLGWDKDFSRVVSDMTVTAQYYDNNVYIVGSFNDWATNQAMGPYGNNPVSAGFYLEPGTYEFQLLHNNSWYGNNGTVIDTTTTSSADGWQMSTSEGNCTLQATGGYYTFNYNPETKKLEILWDASEFTVVFKDWNGTVLSTQTVTRGMAATAPEEPTREGDVQFSYVFAGWDKDFSDVQSNMEITATYTQVTNQYKVTFVYYNADGQSKTSTDVMTDYGTAAVAPEIPTRTDGWVFNGWDKDFSNITGDLTVEALYINGNVFLVGSFNNWSQTANIMMPTGTPGEFSTTIILHNNTKPSEFKIKVGDGWFTNDGTVNDTTDLNGNPNPWVMTTDDINNVNCKINTTGGYYTFIYNVNTQKMEVKYDPFVYTVNFYDYNDVLLKTEQVEITKSATPPEEPTRGGGFIFKGWSTYDYEKVMDNLNVYAQYYDDNLYLKGSFNEWGTENMLTKYGDDIVSVMVELEPGTYTFKFFKETENGGQLWYSAPSETIVDSTDWKLSEDASNLGDTILIANGGYYTFTFNHENNNFKIDYKPYKYEVTFVYKDADGQTDIRTTQTVDRGQAATAPKLPFRPDGFEFNGWDKDFSYITEDITVTASYFDNNIYLVGSFNDWQKTDKLTTYGEQDVSVRVELAPGQYEFKFFRNGIYYTDFESATFNDKTTDWEATKTDGANTVLNATGGWYTFTFTNSSDSFKIAYEPFIYTVRFLDWDGTVLKSEQIEISKDATAPADPAREHYNFRGWDKTFTNVQGNLDVTALYDIHTFEVTFLYYAADGKTQLTSKQTVDYGTAAKAPELPRRMDGWVFSFWDKDFSFITEDITVEAHYIDDNVYLVGEFNNWNETTHRMELTEDENVVKIKITLDEGSYDFKLKRGDGWYSNPGDINDTTDLNGYSNPWDMAAGDSVPNCTINTTGGNYTFIYNKETQKLEVKYSPYTYTVTFKNYDGTILKTETVDRGKDATAPQNPTRPDEGNKVYTFAGWDTKFSDVKEDLVVTATYTETTRQLTVTFVDWDGRVIKTELVEKGNDATAPETPTREGNAQYSYQFAGWQGDFKNVQQDVTITATYLQITNTYKVTFVDYNDKVLDTQNVEYGKNAVAPADPYRDDNYIFTGWQGDFTNVTQDVTIKATYGDNRVYLKGDFNGWGNTTVMQKTGENTYEVRIELEKGSYDFKINRFDTWYGNDGDFTDTTDKDGVSNPWFMPTDAGDCTINATGGEYIFTFNTQTQKLEVKYLLPEFTVVFQDEDGTVLKTEIVQYGKAATAPVPPVKEGFKFSGWDTSFNFITADTIVTAIYAEIGVTYVVKFVNWDGTVIKVNGNDEQLVEAGEAAIAPSETPIKEGDAQYSYQFAGWDQDFSQVSDNMIITATYTQVVNQYEVLFVDYDGRTLRRQTVDYGTDAVAPPDPTRDGYYFIGWDREFTNVTENITVTAQYAQENELFTVKFWNFDGTKLIEEVSVIAGSAATAPANDDPRLVRPQTAEYTYVFTGWDKDFSNVLSDLDVYAQYRSEKRTYRVTFENWDGSWLHTEYVEYGGSASYGSTPSRPSTAQYDYTFYKWIGGNTTYITEDTTFTAQYLNSRRMYTVRFIVKGQQIHSTDVYYGDTVARPNVSGYLAKGEEFQGWHTGNGQIVQNFRITGDTTFIASIINEIVQIGGDFNNWIWTDMEPLATNSNIYTKKIYLAQGVYGFKFQYPVDTFYGNDGSFEDTTNGWWDCSGSAGNCTIDATGGNYEFQFDKENKKFQVIYSAFKYTVIFKDYDGTILSEQQVERGKAAVPPANPSRPSADGKTYTFVNWDKDYSYITDNTVINAVYEESVNVYVVTFQDYDGRILKSETVEYGSAATAPADPVRPNYTFTGWLGDYTNVTSNVTIIAQYQGNMYFITAGVDGTGGTASTNKPYVTYNDMVTLTATPDTQNGYTFKRWTISGYFEIVSGSMTSTELVIIPTSDINAKAAFGQGVSLTVHSYSTNGYDYLYLWETNGTLTNYPANAWPGTEQPLENDFHGVIWKTSNELEMTNGYSNKVGAILNNGVVGIPSGNGSLVVFNNTLGWSNVYLYTASTNLWNGDDGCTTNGATRTNMSRISGTNYWYAYVNNNNIVSTLFLKDIQDNYGNVYMTSACFRTDYDSALPTFTPSTTSNQTTNSTTYYSNGSWSDVPALGSQSAETELQDILYNNGTWAGVNEVWIYDAGYSTIATTRRELLDKIDIMTNTYNNGVNDQNYTEESWMNFVDAYEYAKELAGQGESSQIDIDDASIILQEAYDALEKQSYLKLVVTQIGGVGTVTVNNTNVITEVSGSVQIDNNANVTLNVAAPQNYYVSSIVINGEVVSTNSNQSIAATAVTLKNVVEDQEVEVYYERKLAYTITVNPYDAEAGTLYYGDRVLSPAGDAIVVFAGEDVTITAVPNDGYAVSRWLIDENGEYYRDYYKFTGVKENHEISIEWQVIKEISVTIVANPASVGTISAKAKDQTISTESKASMKTDQFVTVTLTADVSDPRYVFDSWSIEGSYYGADTTTQIDNIYNIVATSDIVATAKYIEAYRKIYLDNTAGWTQPHMYYWGSSMEVDEWPGQTMTFDPEIGDNGLWYGYVPYDITDLQFNDGTSSNQVEFSDVRPNLYNNGDRTGHIYVEPGYYLQGDWNGTHHDAFELNKFTDNGDGTYSITVSVTQTGDGYIYVNPTNELSDFWHAEFNGKTDNPQILEFKKDFTEAPNQVKVEIDPDDLDADYDVTFTFNPETGEFSWTKTPLIPTVQIIGADGRGTNSSDETMITSNNRVGNTYFDNETVVSTNSMLYAETAYAAPGTPVTFYTQVNENGFGSYDYYVYGWVIDGTEFVSASNMGKGLYTGTYIFTKNVTTIVPVYFHTDEWLAANGVELVTVYAVADKSIVNWNTYFSAYTWYNTSEGTDYEQFGAYPGQVMVPIAGLDGVYYTFIEITSPNGVHVSGITFGNYADSDYMDTVVNDGIEGYNTLQTYDYYDFVALLEDGRENITFVIKNTNDKYNSNRLSGTTSVKLSDYQFVQYTDYSGLKTDIFGKNIEDINATLSDSNALYIIQAGDKEVHEGVLEGSSYVQCFIYDATGKYLGTCYSYELHDKDSKLWTGILAPYKNQRAYFSYEAMNNNRYDGEWYGDNDIDVEVNISVNVAITENGGNSFTINTTDPVNIATYGKAYINATEQNTDIFRGSKFTLTAVPSGGYKFIGWYSQDGTLFSTNISYVATSAVGATYTAVFQELDKENFYVNHYIYTGVGTTSSFIPKPHGGKAQLYVGIENITTGINTPLTLAESAYVPAHVDDKLVITIATDALGADKFFAWYVEAKDKYGLTTFEEVGVDSWDNLASRTGDVNLGYDFTRYLNNGTVIGRNDMIYFQFEYTVKENVNSMNLYSDLVPISADVTLEYQYHDRDGKIKSYYVYYALTHAEIEGFAGNNYTPYTPAYISGDGWVNTVLANAPFIDDYRKDTTWVINSAMYDTMSFVLWATQPDTLFTVTSEAGDAVVITQVTYNTIVELDIRDINPDLSGKGFWYNDVDGNGEYNAGTDLVLTYGPRYGYRVTSDMNINYEETDTYDFDITIDEPVYGREQTSDEDGSNKVDKVTADYLVNMLTPYFFDGKTFVPDESKGEYMSMHVTIDGLRRAGYTVNYGVILEQVGSFAPGSAAYPTFEDALKAAQAKNYGKATDSDVLESEVLTNYTKPVMTSKGTYCIVYSAENISITNKNRYQFALEFNNTAANQKKFFNVYSYVTVTTPEGETTTYISNVQTLNIYNTGVASVVDTGK